MVVEPRNNSTFQKVAFNRLMSAPALFYLCSLICLRTVVFEVRFNLLPMSPLIDVSTADMLTWKIFHGTGSHLTDRKYELYVPLS